MALIQTLDSLTPYLTIISIALVVHVYQAIVLMSLANKLKYSKPWLAWIPIINLFMIPPLADYHWAFGFLLLVPFVNVAYSCYFLWKIYEKRNYPGWLSLVLIGAFIPFINILAGIAQAIIIGIVAFVDRK